MTSPNMSLGDRIKGYENVTRTKLMRRTPVIIRLDGKAFHTWTRGLEKPYDENMVFAMTKTMEKLVDSIQGAVLAYTQSDEISIFLRDYDQLTTESWFDSNIQKIASVSASFATGYFNDIASKTFSDRAIAFFDARVFNLPKEEVCNYFLWRQQDCTRNSIQSAGQHFIGHKKLQNLNTSQIQDELMQLTPPINWNNYPVSFKRGICYNKDTGMDWNIPIFKENKDYINSLVYIKEQ